MNESILKKTTSAIFLLLVFSCNNTKGEKQILLADREAPLGWMNLKVYEDYTFEYTSRGLRDKTVFAGSVKRNGDTLFFDYADSIPPAGKIAIVSDQFVSYIEGQYPENLSIKLNSITK